VILERLDTREVDWDLLDAFHDRVVFQTRQWVEFIADSQTAEPIIAAVNDGGGRPIGYFTGLLVRRYGLSLLGSPLPGWTTSFLGFNLEPGVSRRAATEALLEFAFGELRCAHLELRDRNLPAAEVEGLGFDATPWRGLEVDLDRPEDEIFASFKSECRTAIRKADKQGVVVEEAEGPGFADEFYPQLVDVFEKQSLAPPYDAERIRTLIRHVHPSGRLLLLRARDAGGRCVATGIFPALNRSMHFLAGASWRDAQRLRPNEALTWHAMRHWRERGIRVCDLGGYMDYKRKYGGEEVHLPFLRRSRSAPVAALRGVARAAFDARQRLRGRLRS